MQEAVQKMEIDSISSAGELEGYLDVSTTEQDEWHVEVNSQGGQRIATLESMRSKANISSHVQQTIKEFPRKEVPINPLSRNDPREFLHQAIQQRELDIIYFLLRHGTDINYFDSFGKTPLLYAIEVGNSALIELILSYQPDLDSISSINPISPLELALKNSRPDIAMMLIRAGAKVNTQFSNGQSVLSYSCENGLMNLAKNLITLGANPNTGVTPETHPLSFAIKAKDREFIAAVFNAGADVNYLLSAYENRTSLYVAIEERDLDMVRFLIAKGANPNIGSSYHFTPLGYAIENDLEEIASILSKHASSHEKLGAWNLNIGDTYKCIVFDFNKKQQPCQSGVFSGRRFTHLTGATILSINKNGSSWCQPLEVIDSKHIGEGYIHYELYEVVVVDIGFQTDRTFESHDFLKRNREKTKVERVKPGDVITVPGYFLNDFNNRIYNPTNEVCFWFQPTNILSEKVRSRFIQYGTQNRLR